MALANYADLKASIEDWSHRNDVTAKIDDFIDIAEAEMYRDASMGGQTYKGLMIREMETRAEPTAAPSTRFLALPTQDINSKAVRFIKMRKLKYTNGGVEFEVQYRSPEQLKVISGSGTPKAFTVTSQIEFNQIPASGTIEMQYYATIKKLNSTDTTNDLLTNHPDIYLNGGLWALFKWARNWDAADRYYQAFRQAIESANRADERGRRGPAPAQRVETSTP